MDVVIISDKKGAALPELKKSFEKRGFEHVGFIYVGRVSLLTKGNQTKILVGTINFSKYNGVFLNVGQQFTQFVEPFLTELSNKGIYCQLKPESYYVTSNKPFMNVVLNSRNIKTQKTFIVANANLLEQAVKSFNFPVMFKTFVGAAKAQSIVIEDQRSFESFAKSFRSKVDAIMVQEYLQGDLDYCVVIGKNVFGVRRKWDREKAEHHSKLTPVSLSSKSTETAIKAAKTVGADIATVKLIGDTVLSVSPEVNFDRFGTAMGKDLNDSVADHYFEVLK